MAEAAERIPDNAEGEDLPDEKEVERQQLLNALGLSLAEARAEAIDGRQASGIEKEWMEDEEHYEGIDDANRNEMAAWASKPMGQADPREARGGDTGSTVFFNITRPYCDAAAARMGDILLPTDDRNFSIGPTPLPELVSIADGKIPRRVDKQINEAFPGNPELAQQTKGELIDSVKADLAEAIEKANRAQDRIDDWHVECQYHAEVRQVIEDAAKVGTGILKGPIPEKTLSLAYVKGKLVQQDDIQPASRRISYWNFFPDPACGNSIHKGNYTFERDDITEKELYGLLGVTGYIDSEIMEALREGPHEATKTFKASEPTLEDMGLRRRKTKKLYEIWYYYGRLKKQDAEAIGIEFEGDEEAVDIQIAMVNNRVIKAVLNHLDTGEFPYDVMVWQRRAGMPWGIGVSRQIRTPQRIINAAARNLMDNAGLAGGPMWAVKPGILEPLNNEPYELAPRKGWQVAEDATDEQVKNAFQFFTIDMMQEDLQAIIQLGLKMAEDVTGLPMLLQGQQGQAPDTVGGMILVHNNASTVLRRIARLFDDLITEPHIRRYYRYLLIHGEDEEKGDFQIDARGSSALVERDIQNQGLIQLGQLVLNPVFGKDPKKWMNMFMKSQRLNPEDMDYDDEDWRQLVQQMSQPPSDPRVEVAQLRIQHEQAMMQFKEEQATARETQRQELEVAFKALADENEQRKMANEREMTFAEMQAKLTETILKLDVQERLSLAPRPPTPPTEPVQHAPDGRSFEE